MSPYRIALRWVLTLIALGLVVLALLFSGLRLAISQIDVLRNELNAQLTEQFNATLQTRDLQGSLHGLDPALAIDDLQLTSYRQTQPLPLVEIEHLRARLDTLASLRAGYPILDEARIEKATLHLYQDAKGRWKWPDPAELPEELTPETDFEIESLDDAVGILLRQEAVIEDLRLVLHGLDETLTLTAPRVLMTGEGRRAHVEGTLFVEGESSSAIQAVLEVPPGQTDWTTPDAALQVRADLGAMSRLGTVLTGQEATYMKQIEGRATLWGRWQKGRLEDARAGLDIDRLMLESKTEPLLLENIGARAQWLRGKEDTWQAWINPLFESGKQEGEQGNEANEAFSFPERLYVEGRNTNWQLRSAPFDLGPVTAWLQRLPFAESLGQILATLSPQAHVAGLALERDQGNWRAQLALQDVAVSPWEGAPGGGPFDAWVQVNDGRGSVRFVERPGMTLAFPEVFAAPLELSKAQGEVDWMIKDGSFSVGGENLELTWRGARVKGDFRFVAPDKASPELELSLDMRDVNAIETPLMQWLPIKVLEPELEEWLSGGIAGRVPQGSFYLKLTLDEDLDDDAKQESDEPSRQAPNDEDEPFDGELRLALQIEQGRLPYDPEWPALENVSGEMTLHNENLQATVAHAETHGLVTHDAKVELANEALSVQGPVAGPTQALFDFLGASPIDAADTFANWHAGGEVDGQLNLVVPLDNPDALTIDVAASANAPTLVFSEIDLALGNVNGDLRYRHENDEDFLTGTLGARAFDGPVLADFDVGGEGVKLEGRALARGLLEWGGLSGLSGLMSGYFPYSAKLDLQSEQPAFVLNSGLQGLSIHLPAPFGKPAAERVPLHIESIPEQRFSAELADRLRLRWRQSGQGDQGQGQIWLERWPSNPQWPNGNGWEVAWQTPRFDIEPWQEALARLGSLDEATSGFGDAAGKGTDMEALNSVRIDTQCLHLEQRCLGSLQTMLKPRGQGWQFDLGGSLIEGRGDFLPTQPQPLSLVLSRLTLDGLIDEDEAESPPELASEIATAPEAEPFPSGLNQLPDGKVSVDRILYKGRQFGPLAANWKASPQRLQVAPLTSTFGQVRLDGEFTWEAAGPQASLTRSKIALAGGDIGTLFESLHQPVALRSANTDVQTRLAWPGAPWQFALERSRGNIDATLNDGSFLTLDSSSAKLIGLLNVNNLLRRLRLDFADVTGQGTAFNSVKGGATLYDGRLETRGPIEIDGSSTQFSLNGNVNLLQRQLDLSLGVTVPISQNLPLAAVLVGAPYIGGALFLADKLFGGWIDKVTRIYYSVQGPWASPRITVENAE
ncbi:YhdP family protein [Halomonas sp. PR-M31]|uniref:YhdP family protein n=1 Tax=Halomonas sp. PR-M31 TaxID=1471202 RepID=UPI000652354C|nr:YhdP family protein [Halomonas sp. PR-M31]